MTSTHVSGTVHLLESSRMRSSRELLPRSRPPSSPSPRIRKLVRSAVSKGPPSPTYKHGVWFSVGLGVFKISTFSPVPPCLSLGRGTCPRRAPVSLVPSLKHPRRMQRSGHAELSSAHIFPAIVGIPSDGSGRSQQPRWRRPVRLGCTGISGTGKWTGHYRGI